MKHKSKSPVKEIIMTKKGPVLKVYDDIMRNYLDSIIPNPYDFPLQPDFNFLKITSISPKKAVRKDFNIRTNSNLFSQKKGDNYQTVDVERTYSRFKDLLKDSDTNEPENIRRSSVARASTSHFSTSLDGRTTNQKIYLNSAVSKKSYDRIDENMKGSLEISEDRYIQEFDTNVSKSKEKQFDQDGNPQLNSDPDTPLQTVEGLNRPSSIQDIKKAAFPRLSDSVENRQIVVKKPLEPLGQHSNPNGITEPEKKKVDLIFRSRFHTFVKLLQEKFKNPSIITTKQIRTKATSVQNDRADKTKNASDSNEEVWRVLKRMASVKSKYKHRDTINIQKKVSNILKTLLGRDTIIPLQNNVSKVKISNTNTNANNTGNNVVPSSSNNIEEGEKPERKTKSPDKGKSNEPVMEYSKKRDSNTKVFIITGGYHDIRNALLKRGWVENPDCYSTDYTLKWTLYGQDVNYDTIQSNQIANHFCHNTYLTLKVGLTRNIRNLIWAQNEDIDKFFPICYDINDNSDFDDFIEEFKFGKAIAVLKTGNNAYKSNPQISKLEKMKLLLGADIINRRLASIDSRITQFLKSDPLIISQEEWELLNCNDEANTKQSKYEKVLARIEELFAVSISEEAVNTKYFFKHKNDEKVMKIVGDSLEKVSKNLPQSEFNQGKNIWIIKPANLSRGRMISCHNDLGNIMDCIKGRDVEWIAQKYIENPLIIKNKKLDIRQWVLITDWCPLTVWFYDECYVRFSASDYDPDDLNNKYSHLTNNSIGKHCQEFENSEIEGNMWTCFEFRDHLQVSCYFYNNFKQVAGKNVFDEKILPEMKKIVIKSLQSVQEMMDEKKGCFEMFGYDFLIDETYKPWLIEINSSPAMDYSTSVTKRLVKLVSEDIIKVVVDYNFSKLKKRKNVNTGLFKCIYNGR